MKSGLIDEGIKKLSELADIIKDNIDINMMLATLYEEKDDYKRGIDVLEKALTNNPKNVELLYQTGVLYEKIGDTERALKYMEDVLEVDPEHANALNFIGYSWADKEINLDKAEEMIKKALEKKPDDGYIIDSLGWVYFKRGEYEKALIEIDKAYQKLPNDPTIAEHLGDVYAILKNYAKAKEHYERSITLEKDNEKKKIIKKKLMELEERHK
jgi:tetratricopeptide (TPR) repeat protein